VIVQIVRYRSGLSEREVQTLFEERAAGYREVDGLLQKYYVRWPETGEVGGIYIWDSEESLRRWKAGTLAGTLASTYKVQGEPTTELADVTLVLHPEGMPA
jgi:heme-degrading monooxygenase HmoA